MAETSIVIPAYNESARLPDSIDQLRDFASEADILEVIIVDDGSTDQTAQIAESAAENPLFRLVTYGANAGKGYAVRRGILEARGETILVSDADLSTPLEELHTLRSALTEADVAIGSRAIQREKVRKAQPVYRQNMGKIFNALMKKITGLPFEDTQCGFKLMRGEVAREIARVATVDRFAWDVEFLMLACRNGHRVVEVPVLWYNSEESRVRIVRDSARMLLDLVRMRSRIGRPRCS